MPNPFIKFVGGKRQIIKDIYPHFPTEFTTYYEPFLGGGSIYFFLSPEKAVISDTNGDLINAYKVVRDDVEGLIELLKTYPNDKEFFYKMREKQPYELSDVEAAARFIYLNKTCYNGLYRVNSQNKFNVPFASYKNPKICDAGGLRMSSKILKPATILATDFAKALQDVEEGSLIYLDPPYLPVKENSFTSYSKNGFGIDRQEELANVFRDLSERGVKCLLSNSDTEWVREAYKDFEMVEIQAKRSINSKGDGRGKVGELLIKGGF